MMLSPTRFEDKYWYRPSLVWLTLLLLPASWLFRVIVWLRRWCYRCRIFRSVTFPVPVIVVGNITAGGTGKTPCVIALANYFAAEGWHPGIVSRGTGSKRQSQPLIVTASTAAEDAGDEAVLMARSTTCPVVIGKNRVAAVEMLLKHAPQCNLVISDDGLQHYRLARDIEIVMLDGELKFGNGRMLPAGPLREPVSRLASVDYVISNGVILDHAYLLTLAPQALVSLADKNIRVDVDALHAQRVHAVAGIGNPSRFFNALRKHGYDLIEHVFPDHHAYTASDLYFGDNLSVLMTGKDAVKCEVFADERMWYLDIAPRLGKPLLDAIKLQLQGVTL